MNCREAMLKMDDWLDGELSSDEAERVRAHVESCAACTAEVASRRSLHEAVAALPRDVEPDLDLWSSIAPRLEGAPARQPRFSPRLPAWSPAGYAWRGALAAAAATLLIMGSRELRSRNGAGAEWNVTALEGAPVLGSRDISGVEKLRQGEWLRTDANSRAQLSVTDVGRVEVGPKSTLRLLGASEREHRIELAEGSVSAFIWAPPRLFFVETPAGVAEDLGCEYELIVDKNGNGTLDVTLGFVSFERGRSEVIVPDGTRCELRAQVGPGTPYAVAAGDTLREALARFDFEGGAARDLDLVLGAATRSDAVTLWHLLPRAVASERGRVFDRLAGLVAPPDGVTRDAVIALDKHALEQWWVVIYPEWTLWN